jgi:translocation and assembly module TamB
LAWLEYFGQTKLANFGLQGDLLLGGQWDAAGGDMLRIDAQLQRNSGDLKIAADDAATRLLEAGLRTASVALAVRDTQLSSTMVWDSERAGQVQAQWNTHVDHKADTWTWPEDAPVAGSLRAQLPRLGVWSLLAPPGWRLRGTLDADAVLSGTRRNPLWQGTIQARDLAARSVVDGIDFSRGTLNAKLDGQRLNIVDFTLLGPGAKAGAGVLSLHGTAQWLPTTVAAPASATALSRLRLDLEATARVLRINTRPDQRLDVSGNVSAQFLDNTLRVRGALTADQALFILAEDSTPQLGTDVVVRNRPAVEVESATRPKPVPGNGAAAVKTDVAMTLDLGSNFQVKGYGLDTRLEGQLALTASQERKARLTGELHAVNGTYKAYGQKLDIEEGVLRFAGPYDNPGLDVLAIRPNLQQRVGVQISGTALAPVVRLYAEPDLPDAEKLAWLVLGRSSANGGAETALLQQAGLALLGGSKGGLTVGLAETLGLDELSMRGLVNSGDASSVGSNTTTGATVTLGKRLSRNFYVAYERSLAGAFGTFYVFYDLSKRFTLRAETGEQSAVDLIFTTRYD